MEARGAGGPGDVRRVRGHPLQQPLGLRQVWVRGVHRLLPHPGRGGVQGDGDLHREGPGRVQLVVLHQPALPQHRLHDAHADHRRGRTRGGQHQAQGARQAAPEPGGERVAEPGRRRREEQWVRQAKRDQGRDRRQGGGQH